MPTVLFRKYFAGLRHRLADERVRREVHDRVDLRRANTSASRAGSDKAPALERPPLHRPFVSLAQVVEDDGFVSRCGEELRGVAADVSGATGYENAH